MHSSASNGKHFEEWASGWWPVMALALVLEIVAQLPFTPAPGIHLLKSGALWYCATAEGTPCGTFDKLAGKAPQTIALHKGSAVFTAERPGKPNGLFRFDGKTLEDISLSDGFHGTLDVAANGTIAIAHHPGFNAGPVGKHGQMVNAQVWTRSPSGSIRQLTESPGCKGSPVFMGQDIAFIHSSCRGESGIEFWRRRNNATKEIAPITGHRYQKVVVSPNQRLAATVEETPAGYKIAIAEWPTMRTLSTTDDGLQLEPDIAWLNDSLRLIFIKDTQIVVIPVAKQKEDQP